MAVRLDRLQFFGNDSATRRPFSLDRRDEFPSGLFKWSSITRHPPSLPQADIVEGRLLADMRPRRRRPAVLTGTLRLRRTTSCAPQFAAPVPARARRSHYRSLDDARALRPFPFVPKTMKTTPRMHRTAMSNSTAKNTPLANAFVSMSLETRPTDAPE